MNEDRPETELARRLGLFDATLIVMGGIVGAGIFINPYVVARQVATPASILGACGFTRRPASRWWPSCSRDWWRR